MKVGIQEQTQQMKDVIQAEQDRKVRARSVFQGIAAILTLLVPPVGGFAIGAIGYSVGMGIATATLAFKDANSLKSLIQLVHPQPDYSTDNNKYKDKWFKYFAQRISDGTLSILSGNQKQLYQDKSLTENERFKTLQELGATQHGVPLGKVNSEFDLLGNLVKKDGKEITIENTIGPNEDIIRITYRRGITAGDILVELDMANDFLLADAEGELSLGDVIPPSAELMLIPGSIAGAGSSESQIRGPNRIVSDDISSEILSDLKELTGKTQDQLKNIESEYFDKALEIFNKDPKLRKLLKRNIKDNLFDTLMEYYIESELKYQEWVDFLQAEGNERLMSRYKNKYPKMKSAQVKWDSRVKIVQRLCWAIVFDCKNPYSGEQLTLREWLSMDLHHWETAEGHENKFRCRLIDLIPLLRKSTESTLGHASITQLIKSGEGRIWRDAFQDIISSVLNGNVPSRDYWSNNLDRDNFQDHLDNNEDLLDLVKMFLTHFNSDYLADLGIKLNNVFY